MWKEIAAAKKQKVYDQIPKDWQLNPIPSADEVPEVGPYLDQILPESETSITNSTAEQLIELIASGTLSSYAVTYAFCHRSALVHQLCNCLAEIFYDTALSRAKELDKYYQDNGKTMGKLHGLPISLKDQFNIKGLDSAMGFVSKVNDPKDENSLLVDTLYEEGAVLYVKTTVPTSMMTIECYSHIYGYTLNAVNRKVSCGGSSGGEAALIAGKGSVIGFGTDIGGSVRIPASFQGLYGLKPSSDRISYLNVLNTLENNPIISSVIGPICRYLSDLKMIMEVVLDGEQWKLDPKVPPIGWRSQPEPNSKPGKIGIIKQKGDIHCQPAIVKAIERFEHTVKSKGHEVIELNDTNMPFKYLDMTLIIGRAFLSNGWNDIKQSFKDADEPLTPQLEFCEDFHPVTLEEEWEIGKLKYNCQVKFIQFLEENGIDYIVNPVWGETSFEGGKSNYMLTFTNLFNLLDYSSITLPMGRVELSDTYGEGYTPKGEVDKMTFDGFDLERLVGTPVGLQVVGRKYEEEKVVKLCGVFEKYFNTN